MSAPIVETRAGRIEGLKDAGLFRFLGIPYADPPVRQRRWHPPTPVESWPHVRPAQAFGPAALQADRPSLHLGTDRTDEDCLYLNIWTPTLSTDAALPIMVWFHGGGYISGSGSEPVYDGAALAAHNIVIVTVNYRLHVFGYLAHPEAGANFGLRDQLAALAWVQDHARQFGGDPHNVTVFGESAGAGSVHSLLTAPAGDHLFHKAIMQSGGFNETVGRQPRRTLADAHRTASMLFDALGADGLDQLRAMPAEEIWQVADDLFRHDFTSQITLPHDLVWAPVEDGDVLPPDSHAKLRGQRPLLFGWNANEGRYFFRAGRDFSSADIGYVASQLCGPPSEPILHAVISEVDADWYLGLDRLFSVAMGAATAITLGERFSEQGGQAFVYTFSRVSPGAAKTGLLANHTAELPYVFGTLDNVRGEFELPDHALSGLMQQAWTTFARSGHPMMDGKHWQPYSTTDRHIASFGDDAVLGTFDPDPLFLAIHASRDRSTS